MPVIVTVTATMSARCWKQHTCCACGCVYRYVFDRTAKAHGRPGDNVKGLAEVKLAKMMREGVDEIPCPTCGLVQPDMVSVEKYRWHRRFLIISTLLLLLFVLPTLGGQVSLEQTGKITAVIAGLAALFHLAIALGNQNSSLARNLREVGNKIAEGKVEMVVAGSNPNRAAMPPNLTLIHGVCLLALLAAPVAFSAAPYAIAVNPLPKNQGLKPDVIAPGDAVTVKLDTKLRSVGGYWRGGLPTVTLLNAAEVSGPANLSASSNPEPWKTIVVKDSKDPYDPIEPWVKVVIPNDPDLGGKTLRLRMKLPITYPVQAQKKGHAEASAILQQDQEVILANAGAARLYRSVWQIGATVGLAACVLGGLILTLLGRGLQGLARPHQMLPMWAPGDGRVITGVSSLGR